jgi:ketosteroid isomerase-like protein
MRYAMPGSTINPSNSVTRRLAAGCMIAASLAFALCVYPLQVKVPRSLRHENRQEIFQLEDLWRNAILSGNVTALGALLADDCISITPSGTLHSKEDTLAGLRAGQIHLTVLELSDRKVRFYGAMAVVTSRADVQGMNSEGNLASSYRYTHVYARDPHGSWKIVNIEASRIRTPDEPH